jgi:hypothetical protein
VPAAAPARIEAGPYQVPYRLMPRIGKPHCPQLACAMQPRQTGTGQSGATSFWSPMRFSASTTNKSIDASHNHEVRPIVPLFALLLRNCHPIPTELVPECEGNLTMREIACTVQDG